MSLMVDEVVDRLGQLDVVPPHQVGLCARIPVPMSEWSAQSWVAAPNTSKSQY
jgi:hypothetical protein